MKASVERIFSFLIEVPVAVIKISDRELSSRPTSNKWSKKEIFGHLCDSAVNNYQRFICIQFESTPFKVVSYDQNR